MAGSRIVRPRLAAAQPFTYLYQVRSTIPCGGNRAGEVSNGWNFGFAGVSSPLVADFATLCSQVEDFYNTLAVSQNQVIGYYMAGACSRVVNACSTDVFVVNPTATDPGKLGPPVHTHPWTLATEGTGAAIVQMPNQIAGCVSFRADYGTDEEFGTHLRPRADDRGRVYIGPLNSFAIGTTGIGLLYANLKLQFTEDLLASYNGMVNTLTTHNWIACVWSRKEQLFKVVIESAVNDHCDTQRKRDSLVSSLVWTPTA